MELDYNIARCLKLCIAEPSRYGINQVLIEVDADTDTARYVATNGHVLLAIDAPRGDLAPGKWHVSREDLFMSVASRGHANIEATAEPVSGCTFVDYRQVVPADDAPVEITTSMGFNPLYLSLPEKLRGALKMSKKPAWVMTLGNGPLCPVVFTHTGTHYAVKLIVMPMRLD